MAPATPDRSASQPARVPALDLLRLIAALSVMLFHFGFNGPTAHDVTFVALPGLKSFAKYGYLGVQLFFVISGFVIAYSADRRTATDFAIGRAARIYPAFVFCMTLTFLVTLTLGAPNFEGTFGQWAANLLIGAPAVGEPYLDNVYWTLLLELTFYAWVSVLLRLGLFPKWVTVVIATWMVISVLNEGLFDSHIIRKLFLTDQSGFFATGLLLYEMFAGRRTFAVQILLAVTTACAVVQGVVNVNGWRQLTGAEFDNWTVAALCLGIIAITAIAVQVRNIPLPATWIVAAGGLTYPFYLLHQKIGYILFLRLKDLGHPAVLVLAIAAAMLATAWAVWRYIDRPGQQLMKRALLGIVRTFNPNANLSGAKPRARL